jgi:hypothetical protein
MNFTPSAFGREYNYPFKVCKQTLVYPGSLVGVVLVGVRLTVQVN